MSRNHPLRTVVKCKHCNGIGEVFTVSPDLLRLVRKRAGISVRALAKQAGLSAPYLSDVELGRRNATERVEKIYEGLK